MISFIKKNINPVLIVGLVLFIAFFGLVLKVNFMQNDDWNRTTSVIRFLSKDTSLLQVTATTFYTQGILGFLFAYIFGWKRLPFLTLLISVLNFVIFAKILIDHFEKSKLKSIIISLVFFFTPLHIYSSIGFMTENYTMFFMLLALYFLLQYERDKELKNFALFNISGVLSFFTKQSGIIINFAYIPYLIFKKRFKEAAFQIAIVGGLLLYYFFLFPRTKEMYDKGFIFENLLDGKYVYSLVYGIILVLTSFVLPFAMRFVFNTVFENRKKALNVLVIFVSAGLLFFILNKYFYPGKISWEEFPYFENTFERTGFFPRSILGTKYHFKWNYDIFKFWDLSAKIVLSLALPCLIFNRKKLINIYSISIFGYLLLMIFTQVFFDRYILPLVPLAILFFLYVTPQVREWDDFSIFVSSCFLVFTAFISTQMAWDFVVSNNYVWGRSEGLVRDGVYPGDIRATMAWGKLHGLSENPSFIFSFSSPEKEPEYMEKYSLFEEKSLDFKGSIFVEPTIYLYKIKN